MAFRSTLRSGADVWDVREAAKQTRQANCLIMKTSVRKRGGLEWGPNTNNARVSAKYPGQFYRRDDEDGNPNDKGVCRSLGQFGFCFALCSGGRRLCGGENCFFRCGGRGGGRFFHPPPGRRPRPRVAFGSCVLRGLGAARF